MALAAFRDGVRRVAAAPLLFLLLYGPALLYGLTLAVAPATGSPAGEAAVEPVGPAGGVVAAPHALGPNRSGLAAVAAFIRPSGGQSRAGAVGTALTGMTLWAFLTGGALDRLARQGWTANAGFLTSCRHHFWPLTRLALLAAGMHWLLYGVLRFRSFAGADAPAGGGIDLPADAAGTALYWLLGAAGAAVGLVIDYARVRVVVEDRRSAIGAFRAALRFMARRPAAIAGLWLLNAVLLALLSTGCALLAPTATGPGRIGPFLVGQACTAAQLFAMLVAWASQTAYFQNQLAHPTYVARARVSPTGGSPSVQERGGWAETPSERGVSGRWR